MLAVCGAALCENVEGSFLCLCASDLEEYDAQEGHCRPRGAAGEAWDPQHGAQRHLPYGAQSSATPAASSHGSTWAQAWGHVERCRGGEE